MKTLVLDVSKRPINIVSTRRALSLCIVGKAIALKEDKNIVIRSEKQSFYQPLVIQILNYEFLHKLKYTEVLPFSRDNIYTRDNGHCMYCGKRVSKSDFTLDHVIPQFLGGPYNWTNLVVACKNCNGIKSQKTLKQSGLRLIKEPVVPKLNCKISRTLLNKISLGLENKEIWKDYLDLKILG
jgi:5-methylcytosine-specific restriction endonuclease McrA